MIRYTVSEKLSIINTAKESGNIKQTCKKYSISRTQFYRYKKKFDKQGIIGLRNENRYRVKKRKYDSHTVSNIVLLAITYPTLSVADIAKKLEEEQVFLSPMGVYNILKSYKLESKYNRWKILEYKIKSGDIRHLNIKQKLFLSNSNPCFSYYGSIHSPAQELSQDIITYKDDNGNQYYLYVVIDRFSNFLFARLETTKEKKYLIKLLQQVLNKLDKLNLFVSTVYTSNLNIFLGGKDCTYKQTLLDNDLDMKILEIRPDYDSCIRNFLETVLFSTDVKKYLQSLLNNRQGLNNWVTSYNNHYHNNNYPHYGKSPSQLIKHYLDTKSTWLKAYKIIQKSPNFIIPITSKIKAKKIKKANISSSSSIIYATQNSFRNF